jgi:hypothetical protein
VSPSSAGGKSTSASRLTLARVSPAAHSASSIIPLNRTRTDRRPPLTRASPAVMMSRPARNKILVQDPGGQEGRLAAAYRDGKARGSLPSVGKRVPGTIRSKQKAVESIPCRSATPCDVLGWLVTLIREVELAERDAGKFRAPWPAVKPISRRARYGVVL